MDSNDIIEKIKEKFPEADLKVTTDGHRFRAVITDETFAPFNKIERESQINAIFFDEFKSGNLHALSLKIIVPSEIEENQ